MAKLNVEITYVAADAKAFIQNLEVPEDCTIAKAIALSDIKKSFPDLSINDGQVGIFSQRKTLTDVLKEGDRIEIYRELTLDPMEKRRRLAARRKK